MKTRIKNIAAAAIWWSGIGPLLRFWREPRLLALAYHRVNAIAHPLTVHTRAFAKHIAYLKHRGYVFITFHALAQTFEIAHLPRLARLASKRGKAGLPRNRKIALVYFDDGFRDLPEMDIPATFFLTTDYLDQKNGAEYLTWQGAKLLLQTRRGEIGSHSMTHRKLTKMPLVEAREEMTRSKQLLEERLGVPIASFSYPKGRGSQELETLAREVGYTITTADKRFHKVRPDSNELLSVFKLKILGLL